MENFGMAYWLGIPRLEKQHRGRASYMPPTQQKAVQAGPFLPRIKQESLQQCQVSPPPKARGMTGSPTNKQPGSAISFSTRSETSLHYWEIPGWPNGTGKKNSTSDQPGQDLWPHWPKTPLFHRDIRWPSLGKALLMKAPARTSGSPGGTR